MQGRPDVIVFNNFNLQELEKLITATEKELEQLQAKPEEKAVKSYPLRRVSTDLSLRIQALEQVLLKKGSQREQEYKEELQQLKALIKPQRRLEKLRAERIEARRYLKNLQSQPENEFVRVKSILFKKIELFEENCWPSLYWRLQVLQLKRMIDEELLTATAISIEEKQPTKMSGTEEPRASQLRYGLLCGFLWVKWRELQVAMQDSRPMRQDKEQLTAAIFEALQTCHITEDGDLPDEMAAQSSCVDFYWVLFANRRPLDYSDLAKNDHQRWMEELRKHDEWSWNLEGRCADDENWVLVDFCMQVTKVVHRLSTYFQGDIPHVDANVYIEILRQTRELMQGTGDIVRYQTLAKAVFEANPTSLGRKLAGAMLCLLGVIFIAAAVMSILATSGASLFFSALFLKAGSAALAVVATTMVGSVILAPLTLWQGVSFFRPHVLGKEMMTLAGMLEKKKDIPDQLQEVKGRCSQQQSVRDEDDLWRVARTLQHAGI